MYIFLLPPAYEVKGGNVFSRVCHSVSCHSVCPHVEGGSHVTITHDALDLTVKAPLQPRTSDLEHPPHPRHLVVTTEAYTVSASMHPSGMLSYIKIFLYTVC